MGDDGDDDNNEKKTQHPKKAQSHQLNEKKLKVILSRCYKLEILSRALNESI